MQKIEFLGLAINSATLELSLKKTKIQKIVSECQNLLNSPQRGYTFMMPTKKQFCDPPTPYPTHSQKFTIDLLLKNNRIRKHVTNFKTMWNHSYCRVPCKLHVTGDWESRNNSDSSEWKLAPQLFQIICQLRGTPEIDRFASKLFHQINIYFLWRPDPLIQATKLVPQKSLRLPAHFA